MIITRTHPAHETRFLAVEKTDILPPIRKNVIKFQVGYCKTVMNPILFADNHICQFEAVSYKISERTNIGSWGKGRLDHAIHI